MKLQNKKTGEIRELPDGFFCGDSLKKICEDWEDYEEPKEHWYVSSYGNLAKTDVMTDLHRGAEEIGNLFETREEAEKVVEKLKAWKRLKEAKFRIKEYEYRPIEAYNASEQKYNIISADGIIEFSMFCYEDFSDDLNLLFGGEE